MKQMLKEHLETVSHLAEVRLADLKRETLERYHEVKARRADLIDQAALWIDTHDVHDLRSKGESLLRQARHKARELRSKFS